MATAIERPPGRDEYRAVFLVIEYARMIALDQRLGNARRSRRPKMNRQPVESSMIRSVGYDAASATLEVEFNSGKVYQYFEVPAEIHQELMEASSHGSYMRSAIIDVYPVHQVRTTRSSRRR
jgi:hypothetical protein